MGVSEIGWKVMAWIYLAEDTDQWQVLMNAIINLRVT